MAKGRLQAVKNVEGDLLKIAGVAVLGTVGIYALIKSAPAIGDLFNKGISNIVSGIVSGLPSFGGSSTTPASGGSTSTPASGGQSLEQFLAQNPHPAEQGLAPIVAHDYSGHGQLLHVTSDDLTTAERILAGDLSSPNLALAENQGIKQAESMLIAGLGKSDLDKLTGQNIVGTYIVPSGSVEPLTQNAVDYYANVLHRPLKMVTHF